MATAGIVAKWKRTRRYAKWNRNGCRLSAFTRKDEARGLSLPAWHLRLALAKDEAGGVARRNGLHLERLPRYRSGEVDEALWRRLGCL